MRKTLGLAILAILAGGCATQTLPGKVVVVDSVFDGRPANSGLGIGGAAIQGAATGGATLSSALRTGLAVGSVATVTDAVMNRDKTVTVYMTRDGVRRSFSQKPTPEIFQLKPGDRAVYALDKDGDLVLVPEK